MVMRVVALLGLMAASLGASADVYKWVDPQGRVHYSDRPDAEGAERVAVLSRRANPEAVAERTDSEAAQRAQVDAQASEQRREQTTNQAVQKDVAKTRETQCKDAKEQYRVAIESQKLYRVGKDGERQYLTSAEIDEARMNARRAMDEICGPSG
ncbi:MAG TPA: DUF4124 domain-containing protein [Steroidobacteraceae bacterium]|nr:DUF4124 domain-containing protein [Steroidobacteraceae bacterium]